ncbi:hypothetical protein [Streptomyces sp. NPDC005408]|uniref:hypothetical protein n=1 Tax=Streptomyces sp. NPDC005408 TaxID=3155341 RepID=UPI0033A46890
MLSLVGVALGAGGSLFGQYLVSRTNARQLDAQEWAAHRAELKEVILKFLGVAAQISKTSAADSRIGATDGVSDRIVDDLWLAQAEIDLAARTEPLRGATYRYALRLAATVRGEAVDVEALREAQVHFMDAAYDDLWPSQRRSAGRTNAP